MRSKFDYRMYAIILGSLAVVGSSIVGICALTNKSNNLVLSTSSGTVNIPTNTSKLNQKIGAVRHYQNNGFSGVKLKNGGFVALTGDASATRTDMFGNIIWEFDPKTISSTNASDFSSKKVIEVVQDEDNSSIFYLLLVPTEAPNQLTDLDPTDPTYYDKMIGSTTESVKWQGTVVQIQEDIYKYSAGTWTPSITILSHTNIDPQQMVNNYPSAWKGSNKTPPSFFDKKDHPSWYINASNEKVNAAGNSLDTQSSSITGSKGIVLPWKQYITNLGNMYAKNGQVFIFGGNGSMYNDPEALSIGMFRITFESHSVELKNNEVTGIPYAYLLSNLEYNPTGSQGNPQVNWNKCYAPIKQDENFSYVPRLAVGGVQTNVTSGTQFLYLSGAITVGQVVNSQNRAWKPKTSESDLSGTIADATATTLQQQRSLQLSGTNILSTTTTGQKTAAAERNSIDPCLLFGTAFNITELGKVNIVQNTTANAFSKVLVNNNYFDIGSTVGNSSTSGTYYFFDQKQLKASVATSQVSWAEESVKENTHRLMFQSNVTNKPIFAPIKAPTANSNDVDFSITSSDNSALSYSEFDFFTNGKSRPVYEFKDLNTSLNGLKVDGSAMASYSWNLPLLVDNARNYYYPTLCYGYSLKSVGSLTKVKSGSQVGYAMQVGKSILFINEPKFDATSIVYHAPSSVSIGDETTFGDAKFGNASINSASNNSNKYLYKFAEITKLTGEGEVSAIDIMKQLPFSYSGKLTIDRSILMSGTTQLVAGIKDLNLTVSDIAGTFKVSTDPYATTASNKNTLSSPVLPWNQFMGLASTSDGGSLASSWATSTTTQSFAVKASTNSTIVPNESKHFALTSQPKFSDFTGKTWTSDLTFQDGVKQGWFEKTDTQSSSVTESKPAIEVVDANMQNVTKDTYFKTTTTTTNQKNPGVVFSHGLSNSSNPVIYGQQIISSTTGTSSNSGVAYVNVGSTQYKTTNDVVKTDVLGSVSFKTDVTLRSLGISNVNELFDKTFNDGKEYIDSNNQYISLVKSEYVSKLLNNPTAPNYSNNLDPANKPANNSWYQIYAFIDSTKTKIHFVAYAWNPLTKAYDMSPASSGGGFVIGNEVNLPDILPSNPGNNENKGQESVDDSWVIPVAVTVPIVLILIISLVTFFVIRSRKNKQ